MSCCEGCTCGGQPMTTTINAASTIACDDCGKPVPITIGGNSGLGMDGRWRHVKCPVDTPSLSLLVIDLGESCVVKVEKGDDLHLPGIAISIAGTSDRASLCDNSFSEVKAAIDAMGEKPVPRIERDPELKETRHYHIYWDTDDVNAAYPLDYRIYDSLSQLAGVTIPVWTGGQWTELTRAGTFNPLTGDDVTHFRAWRFTR